MNKDEALLRLREIEADYAAELSRLQGEHEQRLRSLRRWKWIMYWSIIVAGLLYFLATAASIAIHGGKP